jgi:biopolymer transport protein ExbD
MIKIDEEKDDVRIEILPMIDVVFCILTFFILGSVTLTRQNAINVDLPRASTSQTQLRKLLVVGLGPVGDLYVEKAPVNPEQLLQSVQNFIKSSPNGTVVLYASRASSYNDVVQLLDLLKTVTPRVSLATTTQGDNLNQFSPNAPGAIPAPPTIPGAPASPVPGLGTPSGTSPSTIPTAPSTVPGGAIAPSAPSTQPSTAPSQVPSGSSIPSIPSKPAGQTKPLTMP